MRYSLSIKLSKYDYIRMSIYTWSRSRLFWSLLLTIAVLVHLLARLSAHDQETSPFMRTELFIWIITAVAVGGVVAILGLRIVFQLSLFVDATLFDEREFNITNDTVIINGPGANSEMNWNFFKLVRTTKSYCYLYVSSYSAFIIPRRCLSDDSAWDEFCSFCKNQFQLTKAHAEQ